MTGVTFEVTNLDTYQMHSYVTGVNGLLQITLTDFTLPSTPMVPGTRCMSSPMPFWTNGTSSRVPDFYFYISATGGWNDTYYDDDRLEPSLGHDPVLPWAFDLTSRHWVVDPKRQSYDLSEFTLTANPDVLQLPGETISLLTVTALNQYGATHGRTRHRPDHRLRLSLRMLMSLTGL